MGTFTVNHHMLKEIIMERGGIIPFRDFMEYALYHDTFGYYRKSPLRIGRAGDFVTSPHTGPLFGALVAVQLKNLAELSGIKPFTIVEMGAGHGFMAMDILSYLLKFEPGFYDVARYIIVEPSQESRRAQVEKLAKFAQKIEFCSSVSELPETEGCLISNELIDAFPVHLIEKKDGRYREIAVSLSKDMLFEDFIEIEPGSKLASYISSRIPHDLPDGYRTEVNLEMADWIMAIASRFVRGFIFTIDYGHSAEEYFHLSRNRGTLLCYRQHKTSENYLDMPGEQDITAHVNFTDLRDWGAAYGFETLGYAEQWAFLGGLDFEKTYLNLFKRIDPFSPEIGAVKMLIMPHCMGATHKVMIQGKDVQISDKAAIKGFSLRNVMDRL